MYFDEKHPPVGKFETWTQDLKVDNGYLYLATSEGLIIYDKNKDKWFGFNDNEFLGWAWFENLRIDGDFLWLGSRARSEGLTRFDKKLWLEYKEMFP